VSAVVWALVWRVDVSGGFLGGQTKSMAAEQAAVVQASQAVRPAARPNPSSIVRLGSRSGLHVRVKVPTRWTVRGERFGTVSVLVPVGKTPWEAFEVAFAQRGFQVVQ
jgi:hypothetical protein